ncbi:MAG: peptidoglycan DD-metalloendopeptidase family protein [Clostridiales bacterium]|jgi:murein DD-endopeptidase MepM/ murein hydrolase activator NlpD|nr:peptidoglycan DD-metalloendopeptidase family protein [Clostridiales bacterium]
MRRRILIMAAAAVSSVLTVFSLRAEEIPDLQERHDQVIQDEQNTQQQLDETKQQKSQTEIEMETIDGELNKATEALLQVNEKLDKTNEELDATEQELVLAQEERQAQYNALKKRIRYMYVNGKIGYLDVLFEAKSFADFINRVEYINRIVKNDNTLMAKMVSAEALITQKVEEVDKQKSSIEILAYEQEQKQTSLQDTLTKKQALYDQLDGDEKKYQEKLASLEQTQREIEDLIRKAQAESGFSQNTQSTPGGYASSSVNSSPYSGRMGWPVVGYFKISDTYRVRSNPVNGRRELHTGLDIPAPTGTSIVAAEGGVCIYSGWKNGYGYTIVLDHGNGISTLYGHNSRLVAKVGESVQRGQIISKAGSTGNSTGPHCHFEVRINGATVNPTSYLNA